MGGGTNDTSSTNRTLTPMERQGHLASMLSTLTGDTPDNYYGFVMNADEINKNGANALSKLGYTAPTKSDPGAAKQLSGGDYNALERNILTSLTTPMEKQQKLAMEGINQNAAKRGIWSSGLVMQDENDQTDNYNAQLKAAAAQAAAQRYQLESGDNSATNTYNLSKSAQDNSLAMENASREYNAKWAPANYLKDAYNATGGSFSQGSSGGWNFSV